MLILIFLLGLQAHASECEDPAKLIDRALFNVEGHLIVDALDDLERAEHAFGCSATAEPTTLALMLQALGVIYLMDEPPFEELAAGAFASSYHLVPDQWHDGFDEAFEERYRLAAEPAEEGQLEVPGFNIPGTVAVDGTVVELPVTLPAGIHLVQVGVDDGIADAGKIVDVSAGRLLTVAFDASSTVKPNADGTAAVPGFDEYMAELREAERYEHRVREAERLLIEAEYLAEVARQVVEERKQEAIEQQQEITEERERLLLEAEFGLLAQATEEWWAGESIREEGGQEAVESMVAFVETYRDATIVLGEDEKAVTVPEVAVAGAWLEAHRVSTGTPLEFDAGTPGIPTDVQLETSDRHPSRALAISGTVASLAALGVLQYSVATKQQFMRTPNSAEAEKWLKRNHVGSAVGIALGTTGAGLIVTSVVVGRW